MGEVVTHVGTSGTVDEENYVKFVVLLIAHTRTAQSATNQAALSLLHTAILFVLGKLYIYIYIYISLKKEKTKHYER